MSTIHEAITEAMREIGRIGIAKLSKNKDQGYFFRGVESAMNEMSPILIKHKITISSSYSDLTVSERDSKSGGKLRFVTVKGSFKFETHDGSSVTSEAYGEGMDSSDKATSKAQSVAFRTALFQQFVVPTMAIDPETGDEHPSRDDLIEDAAMIAVQEFDRGNEVAAYEAVKDYQSEEDMLHLWGLLKPHSALRAALKRLSLADKGLPPDTPLASQLKASIKAVQDSRRAPQ